MRMKVLHLLAAGNIGGIETLCKDYVRYSKHENIVIILWDNGPLGDEMEKLGVKVVRLHASRINVFSVVRQVAKLCQVEKADALIAHHAAPMSHLCLLYVQRHNHHVRTFAYAHGNAVDMIRVKKRQGLWLRKLIMKTSLSHADRVIAISKSVKKSLIDCLGTPESKIAVIHNGADISRFSLPTKPSLNGTLRLIYVGRLIPEKGVQVILEALTRLNSQNKVHLNIVGDGSYRSTLETFVQDHNLADRVNFLGSRRDVPGLLSESDVFLHMPLWEEGFGITIVEAMAAGKICICAKSGAIPEIITDGEDGFLVEKSNAQQLADTLEMVLALPQQKKHQIRAKARNRATDFSVQRFVYQLDKVIENGAKKCDGYDYSEKQ